ncbi:MAG: PD40 domain-containing protein [Verrucomicrobiae bacterium]|nr:PD40 domain-containing protein [Verrucomicrobiae bacterium]
MNCSSIALTITALMALAISVDASDSPQWLRYPAISPAGDQIAFSYGGDLYLVAATGGDAVHLTQHEAHDFMPVWSPDGKTIAFASDRFGNFDVFTVSAAGGNAERLTFHSANDFPSGFHPDGKSVLFSSSRQDSAECIAFPSSSQPELYSVPLDGKRPAQVLTTAAEDAVYNGDGTRIAYHDRKGYENAWRKHHTSSIARDVWIFDQNTGAHTKVTDFAGEDRNPVWGKGDVLHFLSEKDGTFNVWAKPVEAEPVQLTYFKFHPVRFLSTAIDGTLCFNHHGEIYTLKPDKGAQPVKVAIQIRTGEKVNDQKVVSVGGGVTEVALSPNGKEVAYVVRGEVFVASLDHSVTKRITNTPQQERSVSFSPDGRSLLYAAERDQSWDLYVSKLARDEEKYFYISTLLNEEAILQSATETFQPKFSPDGKEVAFLEERTTLRVLNLESKRIRTVLPGDQNYSYRDGDQFYEWSPDGQWLASGILGNGRWAEDVALVPASGEGEVVNITRSGYMESGGQFALDGKILTWISNRNGMRSHGSWGSQDDVYGTFLTQDAYDRFRLSKEEYALLKEEKKEKDKKADDAEKTEAKTDETKQPEPVAIEWDGLQDRTVRLTRNSSDLAAAVLTPDGEKLYYLSKFEDGYDLWVNEIFEKTPKLLMKFPGSAGGRDAPPERLVIDAKGKTLIVMNGGGLFQIDTDKPSEKKSISTGSEMALRPADERAYMFEHSWRQLKKKFYVEDLHGVDWDFYKREYARLLPSINNNYDFSELLSEMLGELNASHTGSGYRPRHSNGDETASLGIFVDPAYDGAGIRIKEIIAKSPLTKAESKATAGTVIEKIDGMEIAPRMNYFPLLNRKVGERVLLSLKNTDNGDTWDEVVKPVSSGQLGGLLYDRWVKRRRDAAEEISKGRIGYIHVKSMNDNSFRDTFSRLLGPDNHKEAVVIDTRFNGGGWLHDNLVTLLSGEPYIQFFPRGQDNMGSEPMFKWSKPSAVLMGEGNYSDAHMFPFAYKALGIGKLVGMPVPGTGTAVWWETLIDPTLYFGIPQVGMRASDGHLLENTQLEPDIKVSNTPEDLATGHDRQLEAAIEELLKKN